MFSWNSGSPPLPAEYSTYRNSLSVKSTILYLFRSGADTGLSIKYGVSADLLDLVEVAALVAANAKIRVSFSLYAIVGNVGAFIDA